MYCIRGKEEEMYEKVMANNMAEKYYIFSKTTDINERQDDMTDDSGFARNNTQMIELNRNFQNCRVSQKRLTSVS